MKPGLPDMVAVGDAAHGLHDTQTAMYFTVVVSVPLIIERMATGWRHGKTTERLAGSNDRLASSIQSGDTQAMANMAVI
jgi:hypothetical protein